MPTRPSSPDPSRPDSAPNAFGGLGAGLGFFQDWMKAASSALPHLSGQSSSASSAWTMPTLDPEELDKRIQDLKTVQFWLEQNARMIGMTIQTLEVQRMTLDTLKGMKVPLDALRESLKAKPPQAAAFTSAPPPASSPAPEQTEGSEAAPAVNPMQWWSTLTEQFTNLASQAVQAGQDAVASAAAATPPATEPPTPGSSDRMSKSGPAAKPRTTASRKTAKPSSTARAKRSGQAD